MVATQNEGVAQEMSQASLSNIALSTELPRSDDSSDSSDESYCPEVVHGDEEGERSAASHRGEQWRFSDLPPEKVTVS